MRSAKTKFGSAALAIALCGPFSSMNWLAAQEAAPTFARIVELLPDRVNALTAIHVEKIFESPFGKTHGLREKYSSRQSLAPLSIPPKAKEYLIGSEVDIATLVPKLESAIATLSPPMSSTDFVAFAGSQIEQLEGVPVAWPEENRAIIMIDPGFSVTLTPTTRQQAAKWISNIKSKQISTISPYLRNIVKFSDQVGTELIMAVDLKNVLREADIRTAIKDTLPAGKDVGKIAAVLSTIEGVALGVRITDKLIGEIKLDFDGPVDSIAADAKPMILAFMQATGAMIPEAETWEPVVGKNQIGIRGTMTRESLLRAFSLMGFDMGLINTNAVELPKLEAAATAPTPEELRGRYSLQLFRSIEQNLNLLVRSAPGKPYAEIALWIESIARRIERLPAGKIDNELASWKDSVAYDLHRLASDVGNTIDRANVRAVQVQPEVASQTVEVPYREINYGGVRFYRYVPFTTTQVNWGTVDAERAKIFAQESQRLDLAATNKLKEVDAAKEKLRANLTEKYGIKF